MKDPLFRPGVPDAVFALVLVLVGVGGGGGASVLAVVVPDGDPSVISRDIGRDAAEISCRSALGSGRAETVAGTPVIEIGWINLYLWGTGLSGSSGVTASVIQSGGRTTVSLSTKAAGRLSAIDVSAFVGLTRVR